jgi:hypothetical protein
MYLQVIIYISQSYYLCLLIIIVRISRDYYMYIQIILYMSHGYCIYICIFRISVAFLKII